jgi:Rod binding domain-containing protein
MNFALNTIASASSTQAAASTAAGASDAQHRKLTDAAQQFEGMLLQELLKPMREHSFGSGDSDNSSSDDPDSSGFADTLSSFGSESLAAAISRAGGLGIAKQVVQQVESKHGQVEKQHGTHANTSVTAG